MRLLLALLIGFTLAACSSDQRYGVSPPLPDQRVSTGYRGIEIVPVSLPAYGSDQEISVRKADGAITPLGPLWADDPERAVTLQLARDLGTITGSIAAPAPWPFRSLPDARVDVRVEDFLATDDGVFLLSGQYFVAPETGGRDRARRFSFSVPLADPVTPGGIVAARGTAITRLATEIAQNGLR
ncbi:PqiC family protein [Marinibacterium profundimaris]|uniref:ABC-type transport auxiliary lipoprotein component domain-containing protein n=1 Tax=Marinibacterium profundimaris TaxID=1679460 RepID=A0A225NK69_9RHOB|nr:PqiC family protein [Marinibacterium profundimaris]OWU72262.1 hypothetical protein ATO3_17050 [Marinibacterium profundimaris]